MTEQLEHAQPNQVNQESPISTDGVANNAQPSHPEKTTPEWASGVSDEYKGVVEAKGWENINDVLRSYKNMEQFAGKMGSGKGVIIPDPEDTEGWKTVYDKLGRPEASNGYEYDVSLDGLDEISKSAIEENLKVFSDIAFEAGLNKNQAKVIQSKWDEYVADHEAQIVQESMKKAHENQENLKKEWGQAYDQNIKYATLARNKFGLTDEVISSIESAAGLDKLMNMLATIGSDLSEDGFVQSSNGVMQGKTPKQAEIELNELKADPDYIDPYKNPNRHKMLRDKAKDLYAALYPEE